MDTAIFIFVLLSLFWLFGHVLFAAQQNRMVLDGIDLKLVVRGTKKWRPVFYGIYFKHVAIGIIREVKR